MDAKLSAVETRMDARLDRFELQMTQFQERAEADRKRFEESQQELREDFKELKEDVKGEMKSTRTTVVVTGVSSVLAIVKVRGNPALGGLNVEFIFCFDTRQRLNHRHLVRQAER